MLNTFTMTKIQEFTSSAQKQSAFMQNYADCHESFIRYCSALAYGKMPTEDLVQDVLLSVYERYEKIKSKEQFLHYLIKAARNKSISHWRKNKYKTELLDTHAQKLRTSDLAPDTSLDVQLLYQAIHQLPEKQKDALILFEINGFSIKEIAQIQARSEAAVKNSVSRGRKKLRASIQEKCTSLGILFFLGANPDPGQFAQIPLELSHHQVQGFIQNLSSKSLGFKALSAKASVPFSVKTSLSLGLTCMVGIVAFFQFSNSRLQSKPRIVSEATTQSGVDAMPKMAFSSQKPFEVEEVPQIVPIPILENIPQIQSQPSAISLGMNLKTLPKLAEETPSHIKPDIIRKNLTNTPVLSHKPKEETLCDVPLNFNDAQDLKKFRKVFLRNLLRDKVITDRKEIILFTFLDEGMQLNREALGNEVKQKYFRLFEKFALIPCANRVIEITPKYIAVGDITSEGFDGIAYGGYFEHEKLDTLQLRQVP